MQIVIKSPGLKPSEQLLQLVRSKFDHLAKIYRNHSKCTIILKKEKSDQKKNCVAEAKMNVYYDSLFAREADDNFEAAIQKLCENIRHQALRLKGLREEFW